MPRLDLDGGPVRGADHPLDLGLGMTAEGAEIDPRLRARRGTARVGL